MIVLDFVGHFLKKNIGRVKEMYGTKANTEINKKFVRKIFGLY
jgi:hypothetical protein